MGLIVQLQWRVEEQSRENRHGGWDKNILGKYLYDTKAEYKLKTLVEIVFFPERKWRWVAVM